MSKASRRKQRQQQEADRQRQRNAEQERAKELAAAALASLGKSIGLPQEIGVKNAKPTAGSEGGTNDCSPHDLATLEYARRQTYYSKLLTIATFVTVVITAVQWHAMFRQNSLIIDQNKEMVTQSAAAVTAANATVAAANAAKTSNDIVVKHGQLELQAWVGIENALVEWSPDTTTVTVTLPVKNYGQTPARDLVVISEAWSEPKDAISIDTVALKGDEEPANFYGPGHVEDVIAIYKISLEDKAKIASGAASLVIAGGIEFLDVFGQDRLILFQLRWAGENGENYLTWDAQFDEVGLGEDIVADYYHERAENARHHQELRRRKALELIAPKRPQKPAQGPPPVRIPTKK